MAEPAPVARRAERRRTKGVPKNNFGSGVDFRDTKIYL